MTETIILEQGRPHLGKDAISLSKILKNRGIKLPLTIADFATNYLPFILFDLHDDPHTLSVSYISIDIFKGKKVERIVVTPNITPVEFIKQEMAKIQGIIKMQTKEGEDALEISVFIKQPNWDLEEKIYKAYSRLLDAYPNNSFDISVNELFSEA